MSDGIASRVVSRHRSQGLALRVASRYVEAFEFDTEKERARYLKEHPKADPSRHTVKKQQGKPEKVTPPPKPGKPGTPPPLPEQKAKPPQEVPPEKGPEKQPHGEVPEEGEHGEEGKPEAPKPKEPLKKQIVEGLKGLSKGALNLLKKAPGAVKKFFQDDAHRRGVLMKLHSSIGNAPGKMAQNLINTAKNEVHEFKAASEGVQAALSGKKLSKHQKAAIKAVTIHMGVTATAAALSATGIGAGLAFAAKAMARHIALKSVHRVFEHLDTASELHHIGHGVLELMGKFASEEQAQDPDQVLAAIVMKAVQEELANMSEDDLQAMLEQMAKSGAGMTKEAALPPGAQLADLCEQAETVHKGLRTMIRTFPQVMKESEQLEGQSLVWQDPWVAFWGRLETPLASLESIDEAIEGIYLSPIKPALQTMANVARNATSDRLMPQKARIEYAFGNPQFREDSDGKSRIAYSVDRIKTWANEFEGWIEDSIEMLHQTARKARRSV